MLTVLACFSLVLDFFGAYSSGLVAGAVAAIFSITVELPFAHRSHLSMFSHFDVSKCT